MAVGRMLGFVLPGDMAYALLTAVGELYFDSDPKLR